MAVNDDPNDLPKARQAGSDAVTGAEQAGGPTPGEHLQEAEAIEKIEELLGEAVYDTSADDQDEP